MPDRSTDILLSLDATGVHGHGPLVRGIKALHAWVEDGVMRATGAGLKEAREDLIDLMRLASDADQPIIQTELARLDAVQAALEREDAQR